MAIVTFERGVPGTAFGLFGTGALVVAQPWSWPWLVGWGLIAVSVSMLAWGLRIRGKPWWRLNEAEKARSVVSIPLDDAIRYIAYKSKWGLSLDRDDSYFAVGIGVKLKDALASGDLKARGRYYHVLHGGVADPPFHPRKPIDADFWERVDINTYWALYDKKQNIGGRWATSVVQGADHEGMYDIHVDQSRLEELWPRPKGRKEVGNAR